MNTFSENTENYENVSISRESLQLALQYLKEVEQKRKNKRCRTLEDVLQYLTTIITAACGKKEKVTELVEEFDIFTSVVLKAFETWVSLISDFDDNEEIICEGITLSTSLEWLFCEMKSLHVAAEGKDDSSIVLGSYFNLTNRIVTEILRIASEAPQTWLIDITSNLIIYNIWAWNGIPDASATLLKHWSQSIVDIMYRLGASLVSYGDFSCQYNSVIIIQQWLSVLPQEMGVKFVKKTFKDLETKTSLLHLNDSNDYDTTARLFLKELNEASTNPNSKIFSMVCSKLFAEKEEIIFDDAQKWVDFSLLSKRIHCYCHLPLSEQYVHLNIRNEHIQSICVSWSGNKTGSFNTQAFTDTYSEDTQLGKASFRKQSLCLHLSLKLYLHEISPQLYYFKRKKVSSLYIIFDTGLDVLENVLLNMGLPVHKFGDESCENYSQLEQGFSQIQCKNNEVVAHSPSRTSVVSSINLSMMSNLETSVDNFDRDSSIMDKSCNVEMSQSIQSETKDENEFDIELEDDENAQETANTSSNESHLNTNLEVLEEDNGENIMHIKSETSDNESDQNDEFVAEQGDEAEIQENIKEENETHIETPGNEKLLNAEQHDEDLEECGENSDVEMSEAENSLNTELAAQDHESDVGESALEETDEHLEASDNESKVNSELTVHDREEKIRENTIQDEIYSEVSDNESNLHAELTGQDDLGYLDLRVSSSFDFSNGEETEADIHLETSDKGSHINSTHSVEDLEEETEENITKVTDICSEASNNESHLNNELNVEDLEENKENTKEEIVSSSSDDENHLNTEVNIHDIESEDEENNNQDADIYLETSNKINHESDQQDDTDEMFSQNSDGGFSTVAESLMEDPIPRGCRNEGQKLAPVSKRPKKPLCMMLPVTIIPRIRVKKAPKTPCYNKIKEKSSNMSEDATVDPYDITTCEDFLHDKPKGNRTKGKAIKRNG